MGLARSNRSTTSPSRPSLSRFVAGGAEDCGTEGRGEALGIPPASLPIPTPERRRPEYARLRELIDRERALRGQAPFTRDPGLHDRLQEARRAVLAETLRLGL